MSTEKEGTKSPLDVSQITEAVKNGEFEKAVELTNAIPDDVITPEIRQKILDEIEAKKKEGAEPAPKEEPPKGPKPEADSPEVIQLKKDVDKAFKNGFHNKAAKLVAKLDKKDPYKISVLEKAAKMKADAKAAAKKEGDKSIRPARQSKVITPDEVMKKWEALVDILTHYLDQQRRAGRAWRHINQVQIVVKQHMLRFKRNLPK